LTPHPLKIGSYFAGDQPFWRALAFFAVPVTLVVSAIYYAIEFYLLTPDLESWNALARWATVTLLSAIIGLWVLWACAGNIRAPVLRYGARVVVILVGLVLLLLADFVWPIP
jgi:hypothetical protein